MSSRVVYATATTLDGFLADDHHSLDWLFAVPAEETLAGFGRFLETVGAQVMGSSTFEWVCAQERLRERPEAWRDAFGDRATWVFTGRERAGVDGADLRFVAGSVADHIDAIIASAAGRDVWITGGGDLAGQFADAGLLDEVRLSIAPVTLGGGAPLLPRRIESDRLTLRSVERAGAFVDLVYAVSS
ncbi:dihydrofolate reductase family protein [Microbacterium sp. SSW1-59]|uniref:dihydrofolate reductase family protein n=1 Tax=Microbacterium xanthum TaxID=3079794 RepID=UPI002AD4F3AB|nr:dihydrofolate reductase family protein [Microbacterium sp. SSW1-59]MDZ8202466.1 dihydrofolate reductase family protein [Microbacterium sp. SSW1-59]